MCGGCIANGTEIGRQNVADKHDNGRGREERGNGTMAEGDFRFYDMFSPWEEFSSPLKSMPETGAVNEARLLPCHLILESHLSKWRMNARRRAWQSNRISLPKGAQSRSCPWERLKISNY